MRPPAWMLLTAALAAPLALAASPLAPDQNDACGAILCLAGELAGTGGGNDCTGYIERYFRIVEKHHGDFSPSRTARKRLEFLAQCPAAESDTRHRVNDRYGTRLGL